LFRIGLMMFALASLACSLAPTAPLLILFRVLQALGGATLTPSTMAIISDVFPDRAAHARALGYWSATIGIATAVGPLVGGALVVTIGWRSVFWINLPVALIAFVLAGRLITESRARHPRPLDLSGQAMLTLAAAGSIYAVIESPVDGMDATVVVALLSAVAGAVGFVALGRRKAQPLLEPRLLRPSILGIPLALAAIAFLIFNGFLFVNTLYLQQISGYSPFQAGLLTLPATLSMALAASLSGRLTARFGARLPVLIASVLLIAGPLVLVDLSVSTPAGVLAVAYVLVGTGVGLINTPLTHLTMAALPPDRAGAAAGAAVTARQVGSAFGVAMLGAFAFGGAAAADDAGHQLTGAAAESFTRGLAHGYAAAAVLAMFGLGMVVWGMRVWPEAAATEPAAP
jgi:EmrB/QacA subfamily drug resistance transporter